MKNLRILIRERNPIGAAMLAMHLEEAQYECAYGPDPLAKFVQTRMEWKPDLSIIALDLADLKDGKSITTLFEELAQHPTHFLLAYPRITSELGNYISEPHDILYKPFTRHDFFQKLYNIPIVRTQIQSF